MISTSYRVALSALFFAGALGLASIGAANAQDATKPPSVMKQCGEEWKAAKANNTTNGMTWQEFLKQCRAQKESSAAPAPAPRRARAGANLPAETRPGANGGSGDRGRPIHDGGGSAGALPIR